MTLRRIIHWILFSFDYHAKVHEAVQYAGKIRRAFFIMLTIAVSLIALGAVFLLKNLGFVPGIVWDTLWPSILIIVGVYLFIKVHHFYSFIRKIHRLADKVEKKFMHPLD